METLLLSFCSSHSLSSTLFLCRSHRPLSLCHPFSLSPPPLSLSDQNECISAELNDCSPLAACTNEPGTFSCACPPEYTDISPTGAGPGRVCENGSMTTIVIISIVSGVMFVLFVALLLLSQAKKAKF
ncbi:uncharacterized protein LOC115924714 [Strongylocentrotus purpuratus]|uniref:EGF-like domain-containing protein n=1 Tax=Strongylocentrotus purpuratus TaxID=7668 RepID=A0A7M7P3J0_STRPU|nr:uncharacterized protein LOC115924714 [Strongylocentrotus purpuratus]